MNDASRSPARPAHLGWRLLALVYDFFPVLAIWMLVSGTFLLLRGGRGVAPDSAGAWLEFAALWGVTGLYAVLSWRRGGQTLGMRPWRLRVVAADGTAPTTRLLWLRYAIATLSTAACGLGLLWSLVDRERRTWHDLATRTLFVRVEK